MIKFALCDDNSKLLFKQKEMLESIFLKKDYDAKVVFTCNDPKSLLNFIKNNDINVLFLDIDLNSSSNGIDLAKEIRKNNKSVYIVFVTAHFEYIVSSFECKTFDFIQKPFTQAKLEKTVERLFDDFKSNTFDFIKLNSNSRIINQQVVNYIQKDGMKTIYNLDSGTISSYGSFKDLSCELPKNFVRCHKSFIVNINNISNIDLKNSTIFFRDSPSSRCYIGPKYKNNLMEVLKNYANAK